MVQLPESGSGNLRQDLSGNLVSATSASVYPGPGTTAGGGRRGLKAKTLKRMLKKAGLRTSGKKSTLRARAKKAHLMRGGVAAGTVLVGRSEEGAPVAGGSRRRRRGRSYRY
jgi:hypothetical protein